MTRSTPRRLLALLLGTLVAGLLGASPAAAVRSTVYPLACTPSHCSVAGMAPGSDGTMWVAVNLTATTGEVVRVTPAGTQTAYTTDADGHTLPGLYGIAPGGAGRLVLSTDDAAHPVADVRTGTGVVTLHAGSLPLREVAAGTGGDVWGSAFRAGQLARIDADGVEHVVDLPTATGTGPLVLGPDGNIWVDVVLGSGSDARYRLARVTPGGTATYFATPAASRPTPLSAPLASLAGRIWVVGPSTLAGIDPASGQVTSTLSRTYLDSLTAADGQLWTVQLGDSSTPERVERIDPASGPTGTRAAGQNGSTATAAAGPGTTLWLGNDRLEVFELRTPPVATTSVATVTGETTATLNGTLDPALEASTARFDWGLTSSYGQTTADQSVGAAGATTSLSAPISGLEPGTTYHARLRGTDRWGQDTGRDVTFLTAGTRPLRATASPATDVAPTTAMLHGTVRTPNATTTYHWEYGTTTSYGQATADASVPAQTEQPADVRLTGLTPGTAYHARLVATAQGTQAISDDVRFTTPSPGAARAVTGPATGVGKDVASLTGTVTASPDAPTEVHFDYGPGTDDARSVAAGTLPAGTSATKLAATVRDLIPGTTYHVRVVATAGGRTSVGDDVTFQTLPPDVPTQATTTELPPPPSPDPPVARLTVDHPDTLRSGSLAVLNAGASAGTGLHYVFTDLDTGTRLDAGDRPTQPYSFPTSGTHRVAVDVTDALDRQDHAEVSVTVSDPVHYTLDLAPSDPAPGQKQVAQVRQVIAGRSVAVTSGTVVSLAVGGDRSAHPVPGQPVSTQGVMTSPDGTFRFATRAGDQVLTATIIGADGAQQQATVTEEVTAKAGDDDLPPLCVRTGELTVAGVPVELTDCTAHGTTTVGSILKLLPEKSKVWHMDLGDPAPDRLGGLAQRLGSTRGQTRGGRPVARAASGCDKIGGSGGGDIRCLKVIDKVTWSFEDPTPCPLPAGVAAQGRSGLTQVHCFAKPSPTADDYGVRLTVDFYGGGDAAALQAVQRGEDPADPKRLGTRTKRFVLPIFAPKRGPLTYAGYTIRSLSDVWYPVPVRGRLANGDAAVYRTAPVTPGGSEGGLSIGGLTVSAPRGLEVNLQTGYVGPLAGSGPLDKADTIQGSFTIASSTIPLGLGFEEPTTHKGLGFTLPVKGGPSRALFSGLRSTGSTPGRRRDLLSYAGFDYAGAPTVVFKPGARPEDQTDVVVAVTLPAPAGVRVDETQPGHPEIPVPTSLTREQLAGGAAPRSTVLRTHHATRDLLDDGVAALRAQDFDLELPMFSLGPFEAGPFTLHHRGKDADPPEKDPGHAAADDSPERTKELDRYAAPGVEWFGGGSIKLPMFLGGYTIDARHSHDDQLGFEILRDGTVQFVGVKIQLDLVIASLVKLDSLAIRMRTHPFTVAGEARFSNVGPTRVIGIDGCLTYIFGQGTQVGEMDPAKKINLCPNVPDAGVFDDTKGVRLRLAGSVKLYPPTNPDGLSVGGGFVEYNTARGLEFAAHYESDLEVLGITLAGLEARIDGHVYGWDDWGIWAQAHARIGPVGVTGGLGLSNHGFGACLEALSVQIGFALVWDGSGRSQGPFIGCGTARSAIGLRSAVLDPVLPTDVRTPGEVMGGATDQAVTVAGRGRPVQVIARSTDGTPTLTLTTPDGAEVRDPGHTATVDGVRFAHFDGAGFTAAVIPPGHDGQWRVGADVTLSSVEADVQGTAPGIMATVRPARGGREVVAYKAAPAPGQRVSFMEVGGAGRQLAETTKPVGSFSFRPTPGAGGRRTIMAVVSRDGIPVLQRAVASFRATPPAALRVTGLRAAARRSTLRLRWRRVPGAARIDVTLVLDGGGTRTLVLPGRADHAVLQGVDPLDQGRVSVTPRGIVGQAARGADARVRARPKELVVQRA